MSLSKKLRYKSKEVYVLHGIPQIGDLLPDLEVKTRLPVKQPVAQALLFAQDKSVLDSSFPKLSQKLREEAVVWIAYPKKTGSIQSDISRDKGWDVVFGDGYIPVTQVAINDDWSALRFRKEEAVGPKLRDIEQAKRQIEGVDFINRKVTLPKDAKAALAKHKELQAVFDKMSFTHKKEYVESIVTAKKPETRARRIEKMITLLRQHEAKKKSK